MKENSLIYIFQNTYQFASLYRSLAALHDNLFVHADLKPANVMWSSYDGCFKLLDFGLTFHTEETDLHQIQSSGTNFILEYIVVLDNKPIKH